jgi:hypothetical protein
MTATQIAAAVAVPVLAAGLIALGRWIVRAIGREIRAVISAELAPEIERIHHRIDAHMDREEQEMLVLIEALEEVAGIDADQLRGRMERLR